VNLRNRVSLDIYRHPTKKYIETRFLAPCVNLRNPVSLDIYRHPTQKFIETRFLASMPKTELDLAGLGLEELPREIGKFTQLERLMLGNFAMIV